MRELLTGYGKIDILWFDFSYSELGLGLVEGQGQATTGESEKLLAMVRELQPDIIVNDRLDDRRATSRRPSSTSRAAG